jgi:protein-tyrosine-phosphatase
MSQARNQQSRKRPNRESFGGHSLIFCNSLGTISAYQAKIQLLSEDIRPLEGRIPGNLQLVPRLSRSVYLKGPLMPKGIFFLCVANSARSQMAERIARALAPGSVKIWSAASRPTSVRPEAMAALREIGIDISGHRSKAIAEIPASEIDAVITLCAEEECPVFLGKVQLLFPTPHRIANGWSELAAMTNRATQRKFVQISRQRHNYDAKSKVVAIMGFPE